MRPTWWSPWQATTPCISFCGCARRDWSFRVPGELSPKRMADKLMDDLERTDYPLYEPGIDSTGGQKAANRLAELLITARTSPTAYHSGRSERETWIHG